MRVLRAEYFGFCFGVEDAINLARQTADSAGIVYSLGPLIHNRQAVEELAQAGIRTTESVDELDGGTVLIRAHGVDPHTMQQAQARSSHVVDATCVLVRHAQDAVRQLHEEGYTVIVLGDANHPEVKGIVGYAPDVVVIGSIEQLRELPWHRRLGVVAQTTLPQEKFAAMVAEMASGPFREFKIINTLCKEVERRLDAAVALARRVDVMFVLGGLHSANTREIANACRQTGVPTYHVEGWSDFRPESVNGCRTAGVTAGASTPGWIINEFVTRLERVETEPAHESQPVRVT